jgi:hypothetical protein
MKKLNVALIGMLGIFLLSGCAKDIEVTQIKEEERIEQVQLSEEPEEHSAETVQMTQESLRQQMDEMMKDNREGNASIEERMDGKYMCAIDYETNHLAILDEKGTVVINTDLVSPVDDSLHLRFYAWADEQEWLWLQHSQTWMIEDFIKIDLITGEITCFEQNYGFQGEFALEPNTGFLCFSDAPVIFDVEDGEAFIKSNQEITLKLVNLFEESKPQIIEVANSRHFRPQWIAPYTVAYNNPYLGADEIEKMTYSFNQSYELLPTMTEPVVYETDEQYIEKYEEILKKLSISGNQSQEVMTLYGYTMPIKEMCLWTEDETWVNEEGYIRCSPNNKELYLHLFIDDRNEQDCEVLADFFRLKYDEVTVKWLMDKFINERDSYIAFKDGSYIRFSLTTGGFKMVSIGIEG